MSRQDVPPHVAGLAKKQSEPNFSATNPSPYKEYCRELQKHLSLYPHDTNFRVVFSPGNLGVATCLEENCKNAQIPLIERLNAYDRGYSSGVGSLSSYRAHIAENTAHIEARNKRVSTGGPDVAAVPVERTVPTSAPSTPGSRRSALLDALDGVEPTASRTPTSTSRVRQLLARSSQESQPSPVKTEPVEPTLPRKRPFGGAPLRLKKEDSFDVDLGNSTPTAKRVKSEVFDSPKTPLGIANREPSFSNPSNPTPASNTVKSAMDDDELAETRLRIGDIQLQIARHQASLAKARRKLNKSKADITRIVKLEREIAQLNEQKDKANASIPSAANTLNQAAACSTHSQSVPSGSNVQLPPAFQNPAFAQNPVVVGPQPAAQQHMPVASGSNVRVEAQAVAVKTEHGGLNFNFQRMTAGIPGYRDVDSDDDERFDEDGNFFGRGRDMFAGPIAKADDIEKFLVSAGNAEQFDGNASLDKALEKLNLPALYQPLPGMEVALMPHQAIGVAWMLEKEKGVNKGGCMADEMGLGKTVQMIAVIAANRSRNPLRKATLIVAPLALLDQWQMEIEMKTNIGLTCSIYHGNNKARRAEELRKYDIVLTTFQTLANEWPDDEAAEKEKAKKKRQKKKDGFIVDDDSEDEKPVKKRGRTKLLGPLFCVDWYRVVLDEAQNIRNRRTRVSRAVSKLHSDYRWCLTGTPIINCLADAYGLLRFLHIRPWYDWTEFNNHISKLEKKRPDLATSRLQVIFTNMLLRRKKDSMLDGKRLIDLPNKEIVLNKLQFTQEEREIYQMVEARSQAIFNKFLRAGTVLKNYHQVLVLLLRLRQICSHPSLIQEDGVRYAAFDNEEAGAKHTELTRAERIMGTEFVKRMQEKFKKVMLDRIAAEKESADATLEGEDFECPVCFDNYTDPIITACGHSFCRDCITNVLHGAQREDGDGAARYKPDERPCPTCRGIISPDKIFSRTAFEPSDEELSGNVKPKDEVDGDGDVKMIDVGAEVVKPGRVVRKRKVRARRVLDSDEEEEEDDDDDDLSDFIVNSDEDEEEKDAARALKRRLQSKGKGKARARHTIVISDDEDDDIIFGAKPDYPAGLEGVKVMDKFLPSTKMKHMMESLKTWAEHHPDEKTLIVSQWTQCLQLVSNYLSENGIIHVKYQGGMSRPMRDKAVRAFMSKDKATVMLMSLKCGGVGLNLTRANRVINLDLGWSLAIEQQAYDRVHRLGQNREVFVHRLVISDTVEDRILALQERKKNLADGSLGEGAGKKLGRLSVKELANLFNLDHRGNLLRA